MAEMVRRVRLVFADRGNFHDVLIDVPDAALHRHARLIDALREDPAVAAGVYIDFRRLVTAHIAPDISADAPAP
jgi:hypothetical protein